MYNLTKASYSIGREIILFLFIFLLSSCSTTEKPEVTLSFSNFYLDSDTVKAGLALNAEIYISNQDTFFVTNDMANHALHFYSLRNGSRATSIFFDKDGPNFIPTFSSFSILNDSSILIQAHPYIVITDFNGSVVKRYNLTRSDQIKGYDPSRHLLVNVSDAFSYDRKRHWFFMELRNQSPANPTQKIAAIDLQQDSLRLFELPEIPFLETHIWRNDLAITALPDFFLFNIRGLSDIFVYHQGSELTVHDQLASEYTPAQIPPYKAGMDLNNYLYSLSFGPIYYDSIGSQYYGVHFSGEETEEGISLTTYLRVISKEFKLIGDFAIGDEIKPIPTYIGNSIYFFLIEPKTENPIPLVKVTCHRQ